MPTAAPRSRATRSIRPISAGSAPRARRSARRCRSTGGCSPPIVDGAETNWDEALDRVAARFSETIAAHGPDSVAFYVSGQLLIEDYYVANKLMKGFIGSANIDTNSRLCMASSVAGHRRAFGSDTVPGCYEDLEEADLVVLVGSQPRLVPSGAVPAADGRARKARDENRRDRPARDRDRPRPPICISPIAPGADVALFSGLLAHLAESRRIDRRFVERAYGRARGGAGRGLRFRSRR